MSTRRGLEERPVPRSATGQLCENRSKLTGEVTSWGVRFRYEGRRWYVTLDAETRGEALGEMTHLISQVRQGIWVPRRRYRRHRETLNRPRFADFASDWEARHIIEGGRRGSGLSRAGRADLQWRLGHLLPFFGPMRLDEITVLEVDRYRLARVQHSRLGTTSINMTLTTLAAILETAVEYELIDRNPAKGRRRRLPAVKPKRVWLDRADHISALLDAAGELDRTAKAHRGQHRALLATLMFAGLRLGEALALQWSDIDLHRNTLQVTGSKTDAGVRTVNLLPVLANELRAYHRRLGESCDGFVFATSMGRPLSATNVRKRMMQPVVARASMNLQGDGLVALPDGLTPHSLRRTFASLLFALGEPPPYVMSQLGHTTAGLTLALYAREMHRRDGEAARLRALAGHIGAAE
jgi:integrase